jgi:hypothetical protein
VWQAGAIDRRVGVAKKQGPWMAGSAVFMVDDRVPGWPPRPAVRQQLNMGLTANNPSPFQERFPFIYGVRFQSPALYLILIFEYRNKPRIRRSYFTNPSARPIY